MESNDILVGSITVLLSLAALAVAIGPWTSPYDLRIPKALRDRFGLATARFFFVVVCLVLAAIAVAIFLGIRPAYAV